MKESPKIDTAPNWKKLGYQILFIYAGFGSFSVIGALEVGFTMIQIFFILIVLIILFLISLFLFFSFKRYVLLSVGQQKNEDQEREQQLELAKKVQRSVLSQPLYHERIQIDAVYIPSEDLSGDMYAWFQLDDHRYGIILIDVVGHGISASLVGMSIRSLLRGLIKRVTDPQKVMEELNNHLYHLFPEQEQEISFHFSAIYLVIDTLEKRIEYVNAGHPSGLLLGELGKIMELEDGCMPIGFFPDLTIQKGVVHFEGPVRIVLYTDGLLDALDPFLLESIDHVRKSLVRYQGLDNKCYVEKMEYAVTQRPRGEDDICFISITIPGEKPYGF